MFRLFVQNLEREREREEKSYDIRQDKSSRECALARNRMGVHCYCQRLLYWGLGLLIGMVFCSLEANKCENIWWICLNKFRLLHCLWKFEWLQWVMQSCEFREQSCSCCERPLSNVSRYQQKNARQRRQRALDLSSYFIVAYETQIMIVACWNGKVPGKRTGKRTKTKNHSTKEPEAYVI